MGTGGARIGRGLRAGLPDHQDYHSNQQGRSGWKRQLAPLFIASNPVASQAITEYQFYDTGTGGAANDRFLVNGSNIFANSATNAVTVDASDLSTVSLQAGTSGG